ncbi:hypothetical protein NDU88_003804 [Pleurodeles waltl]|uniref:Uncharacterized protein n=1 Tax=Pleurodeles waltl TaxID=8319 RepID=A0AAV7W755_PLEWA|nr:hypothetical protein NDU88_003804 [Pleurodeles waltl]
MSLDDFRHSRGTDEGLGHDFSARVFCGSNERCYERVFGAAGVPLERLCIPFEDTSGPTEGARCVLQRAFERSCV